MSDLAIRAEGLGKRYRLGGGARYKTLRESLGNAFHSALRRPRGPGPSESKGMIWALRDASFEIKQGEAVGILGPNGAGKSTLLKLLSRITEPTEGRALVQGRMGSLLEIGTGFHSELTGRENIYLNGAILGMKRKEIGGKFDEIVAFSELERFLDTPVKHYSSGMYMRLAFAVAAHMESDILVVDEVLAVGDAAFQKRCLGKMDTVARAGRTVLFVSHDMRVIKALCKSAIYLQGGRLLQHGPASEVITAYTHSLGSVQSSPPALPVRTDDLLVSAFEVSQSDTKAAHIDGSLPFSVALDFEVLRDLTLFRIGIYLRTLGGDTVFRSLLADWDPTRESLSRGLYRASLEIPGHLLAQGTYRIALHASRYGIIDYLHAFNLEHLIEVMAPADFNRAHMRERVDFSVLLHRRWTLDPFMPGTDRKAPGSEDLDGPPREGETLATDRGLR